MKKDKYEIWQPVILKLIDFFDKHNLFSFAALIICGALIATYKAQEIAIIIEAFK